MAPNNKFCTSCGAPVETDASSMDVPQQQPCQPQTYQPAYTQMPQQQQNRVIEATPVEEPAHVCNKCGAQLQPGTKFCIHCGGQATVKMVQNLLHRSFRAPSMPGECTVPIGQSVMGGMSAMQPATAVLSAGMQMARSATQRMTQTSQPAKAKDKSSMFSKFMQNIGKRLLWTGLSAGLSYGGYYVYQHKDEILAWIKGLFS